MVSSEFNCIYDRSFDFAYSRFGADLRRLGCLSAMNVGLGGIVKEHIIFVEVVFGAVFPHSIG